MCGCVWLCVCEREGDSVCVFISASVVSVCVCERERERECVCVFVSVSVCGWLSDGHRVYRGYRHVTDCPILYSYYLMSDHVIQYDLIIFFPALPSSLPSSPSLFSVLHLPPPFYPIFDHLCYSSVNRVEDTGQAGSIGSK